MVALMKKLISLKVLLQCQLDDDIPGISPKSPGDVLEMPCVGGKSETKIISLRRLRDVTGTS